VTLAERWSRIPSDIKIGWIVPVAYIASLASMVFVGPDLLVAGCSCLLVLALFVGAVFLASCVIGGAPVIPRILPFILVICCLTIALHGAPLECADLHVMRRIYAAGGPHRLNDWAQELIQHYPGYGEIVDNKTKDGVPLEIQRRIGGWIGVSGKREQIPPVLRIELGGGFFHFGILVVSSASAPPPDWWQRLIDWPPEVMIYHEN
jgi:hypothetical protein